MTDREYLEFMWNPSNAYKCRECPENHNKPVWNRLRGLPCGQQNCWVTCHTERRVVV